jgi:hypothetical protein
MYIPTWLYAILLLIFRARYGSHFALLRVNKLRVVFYMQIRTDRVSILCNARNRRYGRAKRRRRPGAKLGGHILWIAYL